MNTEKYFQIIAGKLGLHVWQVENAVRLLNDGATVPFISRYRKEVTGSLDEINLLAILTEGGRVL